MEELVKSFEIKKVLRCYETQGFFKFSAQADKKFEDLIPIIFLKFPPGIANYLINENVLMLRIFNRSVTFFPKNVVVITNTKDREEAKEILEEVRTIINEAYKDYIKYGKPDNKKIESAKKISWKDIYEELPKDNCGACGFQTCSVFSISLFQGKVKLKQCIPLSEIKYSDNLKALKRKLGPFLLNAFGWK